MEVGPTQKNNIPFELQSNTMQLFISTPNWTVNHAAFIVKARVDLKLKNDGVIIIGYQQAQNVIIGVSL